MEALIASKFDLVANAAHHVLVYQTAGDYRLIFYWTRQPVVFDWLLGRHGLVVYELTLFYVVGDVLMICLIGEVVHVHGHIPLGDLGQGLVKVQEAVGGKQQGNENKYNIEGDDNDGVDCKISTGLTVLCALDKSIHGEQGTGRDEEDNKENEGGTVHKPMEPVLPLDVDLRYNVVLLVHLDPEPCL